MKSTIKYSKEYEYFCTQVNGPVPVKAFELAIDNLISNGSKTSDKACRLLASLYTSSKAQNWESLTAISMSMSPASLFISTLKSSHEQKSLSYNPKPFEVMVTLKIMAEDRIHAGHLADSVFYCIKEQADILDYKTKILQC